jgi:hypothetical protein
MTDPVRPERCVWCGGADLDGPYSLAWFCNGCGKTMLSGESQGAAWRRERDAAERRRARDLARQKRPIGK